PALIEIVPLYSKNSARAELALSDSPKVSATANAAHRERDCRRMEYSPNSQPRIDLDLTVEADACALELRRRFRAPDPTGRSTETPGRIPLRENSPRTGPQDSRSLFSKASLFKTEKSKNYTSPAKVAFLQHSAPFQNPCERSHCRTPSPVLRPAGAVNLR